VTPVSVLRNPNRRAMGALALELERSGITDACISPGSRSTAMVLALVRASGIRPWVVTDERSAGFFALGMAREARRPVVLLSTSGTAAANYLPAVVEAALSRVPLVVLTADRPPELRDCHAAQTIDQVRLFGTHVRWSVDAPAPAEGVDLDAYYRTLACRAVAAALEEPRGPVHLNLPMREPLIDLAEEASSYRVADGESVEPHALSVGGVVVRPSPSAPEAADRAARPCSSTSEAADHGRVPYTVVHAASDEPSTATLRALAGTLAACERGLVVCGPDAAGEGEAEAIARLAARRGWPILADPLSGLRFGCHDRSCVVDAYDVLLRDPDFCGAHRPDAVVQLGAPAVSAALQCFLSTARSRCHVVVAPRGTWPDPLHRATDVVRARPGALCSALAGLLPAGASHSPWLAAWRSASAAARGALDELLAQERLMCEGTVLVRLRDLLPAGTALHVGNSLPVRALDTFVGGSARALVVVCNRGASGIDGVVSTALGAAAVRAGPTVLVVGDLSFLHDVGALQIAARHRVSLLVIVVNNDGGGIFSFLPQASLGADFETFFATPHGLDLAGAVAMCNGRHAVVTSWEEFATAVEGALSRWGLDVIEVRSDRAVSRERHARILDAALARVGAALPRVEAR